MATCKDCLHNHVCALWRAQEGQDAKSWSDSDDWDCDYFDDKSRFVELPCKVGDTVWYLNPIDEICEALVEKVELNLYTNPQIWICFKYYSELFGEHTYKSRIDMAINEIVFFTRKEAEAALAERTGEK